MDREAGSRGAGHTEPARVAFQGKAPYTWCGSAARFNRTPVLNSLHMERFNRTGS